MRQLNIIPQTWPVAGTFRISRSSLSEIKVIRVEITENGVIGRGECRPYARYDETQASVTHAIESIRQKLETGTSRQYLLTLLPAGAARNAVDNALWDLQAKTSKRSVYDIAGLPKPRPRTTAFTLSIDTPGKMAEAAKKAAIYPLLKLKIGSIVGIDACLAVAKARPDAALIVDANEALNTDSLTDFMAALRDCNIALIEQPLPASDDRQGVIPVDDSLKICADESLHTTEDLDRLWDAGYRAVNVKLDKCGGLTAGLNLMQAAKAKGFTIMAGCMVGTSLAMAPMIMLESFADYIDLDGPLLLDKDVPHGLRYEGATLHPPARELWG